MKIINVNKEAVNDDLNYLKANHPEIFKIHSHTNQWEKVLIYQLCNTLSARSVIFEIGAHLGATSCIMGAAAQKIGGQVFCVDTWDNRNFPGEPEKDVFYDWLKNTREFRGYLRAWQGESLMLAKYKGREVRGKIDLIFFDADHSYEGITGDIRAWLSLCAPGCCLIFHDYGGKDGRPEIRRAVEELVFPVQKGPGYIFESIYYTYLK